MDKNDDDEPVLWEEDKDDQSLAHLEVENVNNGKLGRITYNLITSELDLNLSM